MGGLEAALAIAAAVLAAAGAGLAFLGGLGVFRFPDFYTRLHGLAPILVGGGLALAGLALGRLAGGAPGEIVLVGRLVLLAAALLIVAPAASHLLALAAHAGGLAPMLRGVAPEREPPA